MTADLAAAKEAGVDAAAAAVVSELDGISQWKMNKKNGIEGFSWWTTLVVLLPSDSGTAVTPSLDQMDAWEKNHVIELLRDDLWTDSILPNVTERGAPEWPVVSSPPAHAANSFYVVPGTFWKLNPTNHGVMQKQSFSCSSGTGWIHEAW